MFTGNTVTVVDYNSKHSYTNLLSAWLYMKDMNSHFGQGYPVRRIGKVLFRHITLDFITAVQISTNIHLVINHETCTEGQHLTGGPPPPAHSQY